MAENPFTLLKEDHQKVEQIFKQLEDTTERAEKTRTELFKELRAALELHAQIEEEYLYPALEEIDETKTMALEAETEHTQVKQLLDEIESEDETTEEWTAKIHVLMENVRHHVKEEEEELFPQAESNLGEERVSSLGEDITKAKEEGMGLEALI